LTAQASALQPKHVYRTFKAPLAWRPRSSAGRSVNRDVFSWPNRHVFRWFGLRWCLLVVLVGGASLGVDEVLEVAGEGGGGEPAEVLGDGDGGVGMPS